ncbi:MAG: hypothetical protein NTZ56_08445 [Acidobacteria bacterium]|nr:hypothetical protein [Acidobacteriota bacterium]
MRKLLTAAALALVPGLLFAQFDFKIADRQLQVHSFASQGFMYSNVNNYMTLPTSKGSFAFTDGGANVSTQVTDKFRVGAQFYMRNVGEFGNWRPTVDWAYGSYRFKSWFGIKGGKVKTVMGLYNDTQDMDFLHTFALLPQSMYPVDWRSASIAHTGGDIFGDLKAGRLGTFSYTGYAGLRPQDRTLGYEYAFKSSNVTFDYLGGLQVGGDLRLTTNFGAVFGTSYRNQDIDGRGTILRSGVAAPYNQYTVADNAMQYYGQYTFKAFKIDTEYRRNTRDSTLFLTASPFKSIVDTRSWYVAGTYRVHKRLEFGAYRSVYYVDTRKDTSPAAAHLYDNVIAGRVEMTNRWYMKVEGHFFDGAPTSPAATRGFYTGANPQGLQPTSNLLVVRTGVSF